MVLLVRGNSGFVLGTLSQEVISHTKAFLNLDNEWNTGVVEQILANMARINNG